MTLPRVSTWPVWAPAVVMALLLRLPLVFLPGPGRDEAAYYQWARQGDLDYAPLMVGAVRLLDVFGIGALAAIRLPSLLAGIGCIVLFDRLLHWHEVGRPARVIAVVALALTPWQTLVGAVLHPDTMFLFALLATALALGSSRPVWAAVWGGAAALAKPTGILIVPVLIVCIWRMSAPRTRPLSLGLLLALAAPAIVGLSAPMVRELMEFGQLDTALTPQRRLGMAVGSTLLQGGLLLPLAAVQGFQQGVQTVRARQTLEHNSVFALAVIVFGFFAAAALWNDQFKGNWVLPAFVLLWPAPVLRVPRPLIAVLLLTSALTSALMVAAMWQPDTTERIEAWAGLVALYPQLAGGREERVSPTRTFSQRFREFDDASPLADEALAAWQTETGASQPPAWIVSDDYGLASQLAYYWRSARLHVVVPGDGMFNKHLVAAEEAEPETVLVVASLKKLSATWPERGPVRKIATLEHAISGGNIELGVLFEPMER